MARGGWGAGAVQPSHVRLSGLVVMPTGQTHIKLPTVLTHWCEQRYRSRHSFSSRAAQSRDSGINIRSSKSSSSKLKLENMEIQIHHKKCIVLTHDAHCYFYIQNYICIFRRISHKQENITYIASSFLNPIFTFCWTALQK